MKTAGIVAEYNPFHNGHKYHIDETKRLTSADRVVAVMSGNFVQRGETAIISKWARAEAALQNGVDLVLELPTPWSIGRAQSFSLGAVSLLQSLGCVDVLSFGSECGNASLLSESANALCDERVISLTQKNLETGMTFAMAREKAVGEIFGSEISSVLGQPNNTLGIEYILANQKNQDKKMEIFTLGRAGANHDSNEKLNGFASASEIRRMMLLGEEWQQFVPPTVAEIYEREFSQNTAPTPITNLDKSILCRLRQMSASEIAKSPDVSEGIENRLKDAIAKATTLSEVYDFAKTKRYPHARIRRIILSAFLGITDELAQGEPPYIKILAMNKKGQEILKQAKKSATLPIITKVAEAEKLSQNAKRIYENEVICTDIYSLASKKIFPCGREKTASVIVK